MSNLGVISPFVIHTLNMLVSLHYVVGLVQGRRNSIANVLELRLSCTNP